MVELIHHLPSVASLDSVPGHLSPLSAVLADKLRRHLQLRALTTGTKLSVGTKMRQQSDKHKEATSGGSSMPYTRQS